MLGVSAGILLARYMPWVDPETFGPVYWSAHLHAVSVLAIPTVYFMAGVLFAVAVLARNEIVPFIAALVLLLGYVLGDYFLSDIKYEQVAALLDPFGVRTFTLATKYWTVAEKNTLSVGWNGLMLWNRLLWIGVGLAVFLFGHFRFSFSEKKAKAKTFEPEIEAAGSGGAGTAGLHVSLRSLGQVSWFSQGSHARDGHQRSFHHHTSAILTTLISCST
jgi:hypothetical protein